MKIIHIDDSPQELEYFKKHIQKMPDIDFLGSFSSAKEGVDFAFNNEVDLVVSDIEMPEHDGLWVAEQLNGTQTGIVFLTGHTEYTLAAFEACALDYLIKPITESVLKAMLQRYEKKRSAFHAPAQINELFRGYLNPEQLPQRIFINTAGKLHILPIADIVYMETDMNCTFFYTKEGEKIVSAKSMKVYAEALGAHAEFVRIHRSFIVNKMFVKAIVRHKNNTELQLPGNVMIPVSIKFRNEIQDMLA